MLFQQKRDRKEHISVLPCKVQQGKQVEREPGLRDSYLQLILNELGNQPSELTISPMFWSKRSFILHAGYIRPWPPSTKYLARTYSAHRLGIDQGRLKEAHKNAFQVGNKKGLEEGIGTVLRNRCLEKTGHHRESMVVVVVVGEESGKNQ